MRDISEAAEKKKKILDISDVYEPQRALDFLSDITDAIPEEERIPPVPAGPTFWDKMFFGAGAPMPGVHIPQPIAGMPALAGQLGRPVGDVIAEYQAGQMLGVRYADAAELFLRGALVYWSETEAGRLGRKGARAALPWAQRGFPKKRLPPIAGKELAKPLSFRNMMDWGIKSVQGTTPEVEAATKWSRVFSRGAGMTAEEVKLADAWFERHKGMKVARDVADMGAEFAIGVAFEIALASGIGKVTGGLKNFFATAKPGILKKGFRSAIIDQMDEFDIARKGVPYVAGVSMEDIRKGLGPEVIKSSFADSASDELAHKILAMNETSFNAAAAKGSIAPFGGLPGQFDALVRGDKLFVHTEPGQIFDLAAQVGKLPSNVSAMKHGDDVIYYLSENASEVAEAIRKLDATRQTFSTGSPAQAIQEGKLFGYSDEDIIKYLHQNFGYDETIKGISGAVTNIDEFSATHLYRSYLKQVRQSELVPGKVIDDLADAASFSTGKSVDQLNRLQLEQVLDDVSVYMGAKVDELPFLAVIDHFVTPSHEVFRRLGLFQYFSDVDDGGHFFRDFMNNWQEFNSKMHKQYRKTFKRPWGVEEKTAASYLAERKVLPKSVRDNLAAKVGAKPGDDIYDAQIDFLQTFVDEDKARYFDFTRDEAVRQGKIGPGTDVPVVKYYLYQITQDRAKERMSRARIGYRPTGKAARFTDTTPRDMYAPEFLKRQRNIPDAILEMDYDLRSYLALRDEGRKLFIQPPVDRLAAVMDSLTLGHETVASQKMLRQWFSEWIEKGVYSVPTKSDAVLNASLNRASKVMERRLKGKWSPTGRAAEHALEQLRRGVARAVLLANFRGFFKNLFQGFLNVPHIGARATMAGYAMVLTKDGRGLLDDMGFIAARGPRGKKILYGAMDITKSSGWNSLMTYGHIAAVDRYMNCPSSFGGPLWKSITSSRRKMKELIEYGATMGLREHQVKGMGFWTAARGAIRDGHFKADVLAAKKELYGTQWYYGRLGASPYLYPSAWRAGAQLTTWPAHFTTVYTRQLLSQFFTGKTISGKVVGWNPLTNTERYALLKFIAMATTMHYAGKKMGINMDFIWNSIFGMGGGPSADFVSSAHKLVEGQVMKRDKLTSEGWDGIKNQLPIILGIPGWVGGKRILEIKKGEREPYELLWTPTREEERASEFAPSRPGRPKPKY